MNDNKSNAACRDKEKKSFDKGLRVVASHVFLLVLWDACWFNHESLTSCKGKKSARVADHINSYSYFIIHTAYFYIVAAVRRVHRGNTLRYSAK